MSFPFREFKRNQKLMLKSFETHVNQLLNKMRHCIIVMRVKTLYPLTRSTTFFFVLFCCYCYLMLLWHFLYYNKQKIHSKHELEEHRENEKKKIDEKRWIERLDTNFQKKLRSFGIFSFCLLSSKMDENKHKKKRKRKNLKCNAREIIFVMYTIFF